MAFINTAICIILHGFLISVMIIAKLTRDPHGYRVDKHFCDAFRNFSITELWYFHVLASLLLKLTKRFFAFPSSLLERTWLAHRERLQPHWTPLGWTKTEIVSPALKSNSSVGCALLDEWAEILQKALQNSSPACVMCRWFSTTVHILYASLTFHLSRFKL